VPIRCTTVLAKGAAPPAEVGLPTLGLARMEMKARAGTRSSAKATSEGHSTTAVSHLVVGSRYRVGQQDSGNQRSANAA
jgi:hypothetical protein